MIAVADGVGGNNGGREASHFVLDYLSKHALATATGTEELSALVQNCNRALLDKAKVSRELGQMATTLTAVVLRPDVSKVIQVGNTRLYGMPGSYLKQLTADQTTYQMLLNMGRIEAAEACNKSEIIGCLGGGNPEFAKRAVVTDISDRMLRRLLLLTSDGVHEYVQPEVIEAALDLGDDEKAAQQILYAANRAGSDDDKTIVIVRF